MTDKSKQDVTFQLKDIELFEVSVRHPKEELPDYANFKFNLKVDHEVNAETKQIRVICVVEIYLEAREDVLGRIESGYIFEVVNFDSFLDKKRKQAVFPENFIMVLNSVAISSTRGIMYSYFKGTRLHHVILPMIDPSKVLQTTSE
jgi:hypothetical protein